MAERASHKLALDKAVLGGGEKAPALSKKEVEELLKKGAYDFFMDQDQDNESQKFCEVGGRLGTSPPSLHHLAPPRTVTTYPSPPHNRPLTTHHTHRRRSTRFSSSTPKKLRRSEAVAAAEVAAAAPTASLRKRAAPSPARATCRAPRTRPLRWAETRARARST